MMLRPGNAGSNTAADHIEVIRQSLRQYPFTARGGRIGRKVLIDRRRGRRHPCPHRVPDTQKLSYSIAFGLTDSIVAAIDALSEQAWIPAHNAYGQPRDGAWIAEVAGVLDLPGWPGGMRVIVRKVRPHPGAQLRFTDRDGLRLTAFVTNTEGGQLPDLELRHRRRARCEDRIRIMKDTGLEDLPLQGFDQNRLWLALVALAVEVTAWMQMLALTDDPTSRWEPKRLRLRLLAIGGRIARHTRKVHLRLLSAHAPCIDLLITALARLTAIPEPT